MLTPVPSNQSPPARPDGFPALSSPFQTYSVAPDLCLDARRAVCHAPTRTIVAADLHLGYAWAQRKAGLLLPLSSPDNTVDRLEALVDCYRPTQLVLLGDIVHRAVEVPALEDELCRLAQRLGSMCQLRLVIGNHDRKLAALLRKLRLTDAPLERSVAMGSHLLLHGDDFSSAANDNCVAVPGAGGLTVIGHEHPALRLGDGVTGSAKCPCFLIGPKLLIMPAFSSWAAGSPFQPNRFMSALARGEAFFKAVAILNGKLLPLPLDI
jgi:putative SbcD/Mre11-related phosphoesterase